MTASTAAPQAFAGGYSPASTTVAKSHDDGGSERVMHIWSQVFQGAAWLGVLGFLVWSIVGLSVLAAVRDPYALASQRELARLQLNSALVWAAVSVITALFSFFFSALLRGAGDVVHLLRMQVRGEATA